MPVPGAGAGPASRPGQGDELREALLARVRQASAGESQDAEWEAELAALEAAGDCHVPTDEELAGLAPDPLAGPPDGEDAWLAELPGPLLDEYIAATAGPAGPEPLAAGLWSRATGDGGRFAAGGTGDQLAPGPVLAGLVDDLHADGLGKLSDDELIGVLRAARRLASWSASLELAAAGDLMRRRLKEEAAGQAGAAEHADAEVAAALTLTGRAAGRLLDLAMALRRLPRTARALAAGAIDMPRAMAIADEVAGLADEHIAEVEKRVLARAAEQTTTQVRAAARRAVTAADAGAMRRRRQQAERDARVERWAEHAGTAALAGRDLPSAEALAADQHVSELARALRAAGLAGTLDQLRAQVFLALLTGQPMTSLLPPGEAPSAPRPGAPGAAGSPGRTGPPGASGLPPRTGSRRASVLPPAPGGPGTADGGAGPGSGIAVAGMVNLTMPLGTWLGFMESPGEVPGFGPLTAEDSRSLGLAMARDPRSRWCLTLTDEGGRPVAHGCAPRRRGPPPTDTGPPPTTSNPTPPPDNTSNTSNTGPPATPGGIAGWVTGVPVAWLEAGQCAHRRQSAGYRPPLRVQHLVRERQQLCVFPGCGRAARRCDVDHTVPYHRGGRTCECNLAPLCRKHHQAKQARGWALEQPQPGIMIWTTPSGRRYTTQPTSCPS